MVCSLAASVDQLWVTWMTFEQSAKYTAIPTVQYGLDAAKLDQTSHGKATLFMNGNRISYVHRVMLSKLKPNSTYCATNLQ